MKGKIGEQFQKDTQYKRGELHGGGLDWNQKPETYKEYPEASTVKLEPPVFEGGLSMWQAVKRRYSVRSYGNWPVVSQHLSQLLWATQGITRKTPDYELRAAPSAGALYPIETYIVIHNIENIDPGIYHFAVKDFALELIRAGDFRLQTARAALDQDIAYSCQLVFLLSAVFARSKWKYQQRAYRYVYLDAGHIAQNLALAAVSLGLGSCPIAAFYDEEANDLIGLDGKDESIIYMSAVGHPE